MACILDGSQMIGGIKWMGHRSKGPCKNLTFKKLFISFGITMNPLAPWRGKCLSALNFPVRRWLIFLFPLAVLPDLQAQDPFFTQFHLAESYFNPALTGYRGAFSVMARYKSQWHLADASGFQTTMVSVEESMPCSPFDFGLHAGLDREGEGLLTTTDLGVRGAGTLAWATGLSHHNLRFGLALQWVQKRVDYSRLLFSDQLDPRYGTKNQDGVANPTSFAPLNDGRSLWFFAPVVGFTHRVLFNRQRFRSPTLHYGVAWHNAFTMGNDRYTGNIESILEQDTRIPARFHVFASVEFVLPAGDRSFLGIRPLVTYQRQGPIHYYEAGTRVSFNRHLAIGGYYHFQGRQAEYPQPHTHWYSIQAEVGGIIARNRRLDLGFSYNGNVSGLRNTFGPLFEVAVGFHLASSPTCRLWGYGDEVPYGDHIKCPTSTITPGRRKMYESIWYR